MNTHGGKRLGAGRPEINPQSKRVQFSISVKPETKLMAAELRENGIRLGQHIDKLVMELIEELHSQKK